MHVQQNSAASAGAGSLSHLWHALGPHLDVIVAELVLMSPGLLGSGDASLLPTADALSSRSTTFPWRCYHNTEHTASQTSLEPFRFLPMTKRRRLIQALSLHHSPGVSNIVSSPLRLLVRLGSHAAVQLVVSWFLENISNETKRDSERMCK